MNTEKINAAAKQYKNKVKAAWYADEDFTAGVQYAAENPDVIGCVTVEEAMRFAEWVDNNYTRTWGEDNKWVITINNTGEQIFYTVSELFQIFKQQKP